jgi:hypothetical protein
VPACVLAHRGKQRSEDVETRHFYDFCRLGSGGIGLDRTLRRYSGRRRRSDAPTLDELLDKISAMALDLLPDNHPDVAPEFCLRA